VPSTRRALRTVSSPASASFSILSASLRFLGHLRNHKAPVPWGPRIRRAGAGAPRALAFRPPVGYNPGVPCKLQREARSRWVTPFPASSAP